MKNPKEKKPLKKTIPMKIIVAAGGTGGHISPAIAITEELIRQGHQPVFISLEKNREYPPFESIRKKTPMIFYRAPVIPKSPSGFKKFISDIRFSWKLLAPLKHGAVKPDALIAFGGYPVFPALLWAKVNNIPVFMHEQNSVRGLITKIFRPWSRLVMHSFLLCDFHENEVLTGNPLRSSFTSRKITTGKTTTKIKKILITGGSQGAADLNALYLELIKDPFFKNLKITLSTGPKNFDEIKKNGRKLDKIEAFISDMPGALTSHDLILCRSGSGSVYETVWSGKPAVFFPFPHATGNHQALNAKSVVANKMDIYKVVDIRPFDADLAKREVVHFIEQLQKKTSNKKSDSKIHSGSRQIKTMKPETPGLPVDAHRQMVSLLIENIKTGS